MRLSEPDKLVYEAHDYGPEVNQQKWFQAPDFPNNLRSVWTDHWAYLKLDGIAPVLLGEFGGRSVGKDTEGVWQRMLLSFLQQNGISYTYWAWNPNSGDTGGILEDDWSTVDKAKLGILSAYQWPLLGAPDLEARVDRSAAQSIVSAYQPPATEAPAATREPQPTAVAPTQQEGMQVAPAQNAPTATQPTDAARATTVQTPIPMTQTAPGEGFAMGGPFDPDVKHALAGIGGPGDPDPIHREARRQDEQRYLDQIGKPWQNAVYVTGAAAP